MFSEQLTNSRTVRRHHEKVSSSRISMRGTCESKPPACVDMISTSNLPVGQANHMLLLMSEFDCVTLDEASALR
jgi:hypothetical protein